MTPQTLYLSILASSMTLSNAPNPGALASVEVSTHYKFDSNVIATVMVVDDKKTSPASDPLNNLIFDIAFKDKIDGSEITRMQGRLYTGGGIEALEENHPTEFSYISKKLDFYGALDSEYDFFESVTTNYRASDAAKIKAALASNNVLNDMGAYRVKAKELAVLESTVTDLTPTQIKNSLLNMRDLPRYIVTCETDNLPNIEALAEVIDKLNGHAFIDIGEILDWPMAIAIGRAFNFDDHRIALLWNPNKSRPNNATSVLSRKKWRPCVGDYLGQVLIRNAAVDASGVPPLNRPIAGYDFPVSFRDMEKFSGLTLDEEAQNALADARINPVINERFAGGDRWVYGDALTQYDSANSALTLINASEIITYTENVVVSIVKKHLLKGMASFLKDATSECERFLNACAVDDEGNGLLEQSEELGGLYYALRITRRASDPFTKADVELSRRPQGCARQVFFKTTVTK